MLPHLGLNVTDFSRISMQYPSALELLFATDEIYGRRNTLKNKGEDDEENENGNERSTRISP